MALFCSVKMLCFFIIFFSVLTLNPKNLVVRIFAFSFMVTEHMQTGMSRLALGTTAGKRRRQRYLKTHFNLGIFTRILLVGSTYNVQLISEVLFAFSNHHFESTRTSRRFVPQALTRAPPPPPPPLFPQEKTWNHLIIYCFFKCFVDFFVQILRHASSFYSLF